MKRKVIFKSTVKGDIIDVEAFANNHTVNVNLNKGEYSSEFLGKISEGRTFNVQFRIHGLNGTSYSIAYFCAADNEKKSDPDKPSPIEGTIASGNYQSEELNIKI